MRVITKTVTNTELTSTEKQHIGHIASTDCDGIFCTKCPLYDDTDNICLATIARIICAKNDIPIRKD